MKELNQLPILKYKSWKTFWLHPKRSALYGQNSAEKIFNLWVDYDRALIIVNHMVEYAHEQILTQILKAVSDTTRRSLMTQLCQQGATRVTDLADHYDMSLNAISKHLKVLEKAGLVTRKTIGRTHWIEPKIERIRLVENWFKEIKSIWELRLERLDELLKNGGT